MDYDFGSQIKQLRKTKKLTQEQMAQELHISRQAVSNWENNRNLPDIEMLITIARVYHVSLDQLILGGTDMNNMAEKLINDGSETKRAKWNTISVSIGVSLFLIGILCLVIRGITGDSLDENGVLQEYFFLIPMAFLFFFCGFMTFVITGIRNCFMLITGKDKSNRQNQKHILIAALIVIAICVGGFFALTVANAPSEPNSYVTEEVK